MTWHRPRSLFQAIRSSCRRTQPRRAIADQRWSTSLPVHHRSCQFSTSASTCAITAAPPIVLEKADSIPARILPASPSYFSGNPQFIDHFLTLQQLLRKYDILPTVPSSQAPRIAWLRLAQYRGNVGEHVAAAKYTKLLHLLQRLNQIHPRLMPDEVRETMKIFMRPGNPYERPPDRATLDEYGRAVGRGRRKESSARVFLVEGEGEVMINGKSLVSVFPRFHDRESVIWALKVTQRVDKYNVWALVRGGGVTGQAEAITLALGKALMVHEPALKPVLRRAGCVSSDPRRVERKKPGHVKARKMPAWVKR